MFPSNGSYIRITFHSNSQNARPYRGFSAEIRQLPNSCFYPYHGIANGTQTYPTGGGQQVIHNVYGQRLYPTTRPPQVWIGGPPGYPGARPSSQNPGSKIPGQAYPPYIINSTNPWGQPPGSTIQQQQQPVFIQQQPIQSPGTFPQPVYPRTVANNTPIYLASYCDVYLGEINGELRSPGYPFGYPTNHSCIYTVKKYVFEFLNY